jgi:peptidoglycan L-alanyl-D-glutamate endopeptidase CwlK
MIDSRKLEDLHPEFRSRLISFLSHYQQVTGIEILWTSTYRDVEMQNALYARGRTLPGTRVTNACGGESAHQYRIAADGYPLIGGKPLFSTDANHDGKLDEEWAVYGKLAVEHGLEWAGNWANFREYPHVQYTGSYTLHDIIANPKFLDSLT